jgi:hypothetical protein
MFFLIINPLNFAMPTPQLKGVPFSYSLGIGIVWACRWMWFT